MVNLRRDLPSARSLFVFEAVARCGNFTQAARELYVTQPAVSRMIKRLEAHLGVTLFLRRNGKLSLTSNGEILFRGTRAAFREIEAALEEILEQNGNDDTVTLSVSSAFTTHWLMPRMHEIQASIPRLNLRFQLIPGAVRGPVDDVDLGMRLLSAPDAEHELHRLLPEILIPVCSGDYYSKFLRDRGSIADPLTFIELSGDQQDWFGHFPSLSATRQSANVLTFSDYAVVLQAALMGQGIAVGWLNVVSHWLDRGLLVPAVDIAVATARVCYFVRSRDKPERQVVAEFLTWVDRHLRREVHSVSEKHPQLALSSLLVSERLP